MAICKVRSQDISSCSDQEPKSLKTEDQWFNSNLRLRAWMCPIEGYMQIYVQVSKKLQCDIHWQIRQPSSIHTQVCVSFPVLCLYSIRAVTVSHPIWDCIPSWLWLYPIWLWLYHTWAKTVSHSVCDCIPPGPWLCPIQAVTVSHSVCDCIPSGLWLYPTRLPSLWAGLPHPVGWYHRPVFSGKPSQTQSLLCPFSKHTKVTMTTRLTFTGNK